MVILDCRVACPPRSLLKMYDIPSEILSLDGPYIIAPAQAIMADVPLPNILALLAAIKEFRSLGCPQGSERTN
jgi:hypothetical protein